MPVLPRRYGAEVLTVAPAGEQGEADGTDDGIVEDVAGYRVLRTAGHGDRAQLLLGFDEGRTVVLKVTGADDASAATEVEALHRAAGEHVVTLEDVSADESATVLVLERLPKGTLAQLLERRAELDAGEAVTILAPIAGTIERIHAAGVAHGHLSVGAICFREDGAPTLTGFGGAHLFAGDTPEVVLERVPHVLADRAAVRGIAKLVLARVGGTGAAAATRLAAAIAEATSGDLATLLFDLAAPAPVRFGGDEDEIATTRVGELREPEPLDDSPHGFVPSWLATLLPEWVTARLSEPLGRVVTVWSGWGSRRKRLALGACAGGLTVLVAVAAVPAPADGQAVVAVTPGPSYPLGEQPDPPDDPAAAAVLLLESREQCVRELSLLCLDQVVQPDSAAYAEDSMLIRAIQAGGEYPEGGVLAGEPLLVEQLGDAALLDLPPGSVPASVLLMRTTNGWRIRDYLEAPTG